MKKLEGKELDRLRELCGKKTKEELIEIIVNFRSQTAQDIINSELPEVAKEEIKLTMKDLIIDKLKNTDVIKGLLFTDRTDYNGNVYYVPTPFVEQNLKACFTDELFEEIGEQFKQYIESHFDDIFKKVMVDLFCAGLANNKVIQESIAEAVRVSQECY
jgi:hypothetical protein